MKYRLQGTSPIATRLIIRRVAPHALTPWRTTTMFLSAPPSLVRNGARRLWPLFIEIATLNLMPAMDAYSDFVRVYLLDRRSLPFLGRLQLVGQ